MASRPAGADLANLCDSLPIRMHKDKVRILYGAKMMEAMGTPFLASA